MRSSSRVNRRLSFGALGMSIFFFGQLLCPGQSPAQGPGDLLSAVAQEQSGAASLVEGEGSQEKRLQKIVNLSFTEADLKTVLNSLAKVYGLNIVADKSVAGTVTLSLRGVSLEEGIRQILKLNGFKYTLREGILEVGRLEEKRSAEVLSVKYLDPDTVLEFFQSLASKDAVLKVDEASDGILVSDFEERIEKMRSILTKLDQPPRQVMIESKLMDITHTDLNNLGLSLSSIGLTVPTHGGSLPISLASGALSLAGTSADLPGGQVGFTVGRGDDTLTASIDALIRDRRVKVIATPTVLTINNVESRIIIGEKFPIREQTQTTTGTLETTRFVDIGTTLRVTPRITTDGYIQMHIHPEVSSVSETLDEGPRITTREADTTVLVRDGQSIVIGGLLQEDDTTIKGWIPVLGRIPVLGLLFQNRSRDLEKKELVIIITPHIVNVHAASLEKIPLEIQEVGDRLQVSELFFQGRSFEEGLHLKARQMPPVVRYLKAMDSYQRVVDRYPTHPFALESLWRMGRIAGEKLHNLDQAEEAYSRILTQFPKSSYLRRARHQIRSIRRQRREEREKQTVSATDADPQRPSANFGSR